MLIDTHAHLNFNAFKKDSEAIIKDCLENNIWIINVGSQYSTSKRAVEIATRYEKGVYAAVGLHPIHLTETEVDEEEINFNTKAEKFDTEKYKELVKNNKVVAIGETGLDFYHIKRDDAETQEKQKETFLQQLKLAKEVNLPVILHCRDAYEEMLEILKLADSQQLLASGGVIHCFGGNLEQAKEFINFGFYIGITGIITFGKKAATLEEIVKKVKLKHILIETDCPYLAPEPYRGRRNQPQYVEWVARKVAEIKEISYNEVKETTFQNAINLFKLS